MRPAIEMFRDHNTFGSKIKVLHIIRSLDPQSGGPIEVILRLHGSSDTMAEHHVVTLDNESAPFLKSFPIQPTALGTERGIIWPARLKNYGFTPRLIPWLRQNLHLHDVAIVHGLWNYSSLGAAIALPNGPCPYFVFTHGMLDPWFRRQYPIKHIVKQISWLLGEGHLLTHATGILFTAEDERIKARGQFWPQHYKEFVVDLGIDSPPPGSESQKEAFLEKLPQLRSRRYILFLGRIHKKKGCDILIDSFAKISSDYPDLDLVVAGPDPQNWIPSLKARADALGVSSRLHWPGMLLGAAKWGSFHSAEAFILPSHQENFGIAVAEALACGTPVLISDKVNIWREVLHGGGGLVAKNTVDGTVDLLRSWLSLSEVDKTATRFRAKKLFEEKFDAKRTGPALIEKIGSLLKKSSA